MISLLQNGWIIQSFDHFVQLVKGIISQCFQMRDYIRPKLAFSLNESLQKKCFSFDFHSKMDFFWTRNKFQISTKTSFSTVTQQICWTMCKSFYRFKDRFVRLCMYCLHLFMAPFRSLSNAYDSMSITEYCNIAVFQIVYWLKSRQIRMNESINYILMLRWIF